MFSESFPVSTDVQQQTPQSHTSHLISLLTAFFVSFFVNKITSEPHGNSTKPGAKLQRRPRTRKKVAACYIHIPSRAFSISQNEVQGAELSHLRRWWLDPFAGRHIYIIWASPPPRA